MTTMANTSEQAVVTAEPTETSPEIGQVSSGGVVLSRGERWVEDDGTHVIRSTEFQVVGEGGTLEQAVEIFVDNTFELALYLAELVDDGRATENEREMMSALASRVLKATGEMMEGHGEPERRPLIQLNLSRRSRSRGEHAHSRVWDSVTQSGSSQPSPA